MTFLDFFIVNVAIPDLQVDLHAGTGAVQFVVAGYGLAFAVGLITGGRLGDIHGRRRVFATGMALFVVTSAICGVAPSTGTLIAARVAQGAAAALLTPQVLALLGALYTGAHRIKAFTAYGLVMGLAGVFGQLVGGALIHTDVAGLGWRAIFFINVPVGLASLVFLRVVPESRGGRARLDLVGMALLTGGLAGALVPLVEGREQGWRAWTWVSFAGAAVLLVAFAAHQTRLHRAGGSPLVRPDLFGERAFSVGVGVALTFCLGLASFWLILALFLQDGHGLSPLRSGALFTAAGAGFLGAVIAVPALTARLGRHVLTVGAGVTAVGYLTAAAKLPRSVRADRPTGSPRRCWWPGRGSAWCSCHSRTPCSPGSLPTTPPARPGCFPPPSRSAERSVSRPWAACTSAVSAVVTSPTPS